MDSGVRSTRARDVTISLTYSPAPVLDPADVTPARSSAAPASSRHSCRNATLVMPAIGARTTGVPIRCGPMASPGASDVATAAGADAVRVMQASSQEAPTAPKSVVRDSAGEIAVLRQLQVRLGQLLDVDVLEGDDLHALDEAGRAVDVPDPGVGHRDLEVDLATLAARLHLDGVGQVEAALGLDDVREQADHVAVLPVQRQLHLGLVVLEVLGAHRAPCLIASSSCMSASSSSLTPSIPSAPTASGSSP